MINLETQGILRPNFRVESGDQVLKNHFETATKVAKYTSKDIQNEIIFVIGKWIQRKILVELQDGSKISL